MIASPDFLPKRMICQALSLGNASVLTSTVNVLQPLGGPGKVLTSEVDELEKELVEELE